MDKMNIALYQKTKEQLTTAQKELEEKLVQLNEAIKLGDLSESSEYDAAKESVSRLQRLVEELQPVLEISTIAVNESSDIIEPGCIIELTVFKTFKSPVKKGDIKYLEALKSKPNFTGLLIYGGALPVHTLVKDKVLNENTPIGKAINGASEGEYVVEVPAGYTVIKVSKLKYNENLEFKFELYGKTIWTNYFNI